MAIWHFRIGFVPRVSVLKRYETIPISISEQEIANHEFWAGFEHQVEFESCLLNVGIECASWSNERRCWGEENGSQLVVIYSDGRIEWVSAKIDVRSVSQDFLSKTIELAMKFDLLLLANETYLFEPELGRMLTHLRSSTAARYLEDPEKTLKSIPISPSQIGKIDL